MGQGVFLGKGGSKTALGGELCGGQVGCGESTCGPSVEEWAGCGFPERIKNANKHKYMCNFRQTI